MARGPVFDSSHFLGFDQLLGQAQEHMVRSSDNYPPYNVEQMATGRLRITLAVAGFSMEDLKIYIEATRLVILGESRHAEAEEDGGHFFIHRGIAQRRFKKSFVLAEGVEVENAHLKDGLLYVTLCMPEPPHHIRYIPITTDGAPPVLEYKKEDKTE